MSDFNIFGDIFDGVNDTISFACSHRRDPILHRRRLRCDYRRYLFSLFNFFSAKGMTLYKKSRANGGPLSGAQLEASEIWNGRIERDLTGLYRWNYATETWDWELRETPAIRRTGRSIRSKASKPPSSEV